MNKNPHLQNNSIYPLIASPTNEPTKMNGMSPVFFTHEGGAKAKATKR